jgi:hypothetical protein
MNIPDDGMADLSKLKAKATDLINSPKSYSEKLTMSVASVLSPSELHDGVDDDVLTSAIQNVFDAFAGVTPQQSS